MSFAESVLTPSSAARRFHARRKIDGLSYVEFGPDNGAILIDLGEGGLGFQSVLPVSASEILLFKFKLPGQSIYLEGFAEVAWMNESGKGGGLRFTELSDETRAQIREWAGPLSAPEAVALDARNDAAPHAAPEKVTEPPAPDSKIGAKTDSKTAASNTAADTIDEPEPSAKVSDEFATGESAQPPSPSVELPSPSIEKAAQAAKPVQEAAPTEEMTDEMEEAPAPIQATIQAPPRPAIPEFTIEVAPPDPPAAHSDALPSAPAFIPNPVSDAARSAKQSAKEAPAKTRGPRRAALPAESVGSAVDAAIPAPVHARHVPVPATPGLKSDTNAKPLVASPVPELSLQTPLAQGPRGNENALDPDSDESQPYPALASQALRFGAAVAAGAAFVLLFFLAVPSLRTRVQATAGRSAALNPAGTPAFEVEVADISNRRWILMSGGEAGSPFSEAPSRREPQSSNAANSGRNDAAKSSRSEEADDSTATTSKQSKLAKPAELELRPPRAAQAAAASAQAVPPSIFDGITPPIGSLSDRLSAGGPEAPGIVPSQTLQPRATALQSAVLLQRVSPVFPPNAMQARVQGDVRVNATIGKDGIPKNLKAINGDLRLIPAALDAIRQWRYRPATLSGEPIETDIEVTISFQLK